MHGRFGTLGMVTWLLVGVIVASGHDFFAHTSSNSQIGSAVLAVAAWPLVLLHVHITV